MNWLETIGARIMPANFGPMRDFNAHARIEGDCGDTMEFWVLLDGPRILRTSFTTDGCQTSAACGAMAAHLSQDKSLGEMRRLRPIDVLEALGLAEDEAATEAHHCADLALNTLARALGEYEKALKAKEEGARGCSGSCEGGCCENCEEACDQRASGPVAQLHVEQAVRVQQHRVAPAPQDRATDGLAVQTELHRLLNSPQQLARPASQHALVVERVRHSLPARRECTCRPNTDPVSYSHR